MMKAMEVPLSNWKHSGDPNLCIWQNFACSGHAPDLLLSQNGLFVVSVEGM
jgi:hypothetical protein